jgi:homopolymeric O-antigen transport system permease protein
MNAYLRGIWTARYFWTHLALSDLRSRWRRSFFGVFWSMLQPLGLTLLIAFVFSRLLNSDITRLAVHILSGLIVWEFAMSACVGGALSFVQADAYIKQCRHPLAIYSLRTVLAASIVLGAASIPLFAWALVVMPQNFGVTWLALLTLYPILVCVAWPLCTLLAYIAVRFRDLPYALGLVMQALWFASPVYFEVSLFRNGGLDVLVDWNPIYHLLQLVRAPIIEGEWPTWGNYAFSMGTAAVFAFAAWCVGRRAERRVIFYL